MEDGFPLPLGDSVGDAISRVRFAPRSNHLLVSSWDSGLRLFDAEQSVLRLQVPYTAAVLNCCFQDEHVAFSVDTDCFLKRYDLLSGAGLAVGSLDYLATCVEYSDSNNLLVTAGLDKKVTLWNLDAASKSARHSIAVADEVESITLCGVKLLVASGTRVSIFDVRNMGEQVETVESSLNCRITCITSFPDCQGFAAGSANGRVAVKHLLYPPPLSESGYIFHCRPKAKNRDSELALITDIIYHPRYGTFTTADEQGHAIIWDGHSKKRIYEFPKFGSCVVSMQYCHDGQLLAIATSLACQYASKIEKAPQVLVYKVNEMVVTPVRGESILDNLN